jgi:hypothetical protein
MQKKTFTLLATTLLLAGCFGGDTDTPNNTPTETIAPERNTNIFYRPSSPMGMMIATLLSRGSFQYGHSASTGIKHQMQLLNGQAATTSDETFLLLQELGNILQVNIETLMNNASDRQVALDGYLNQLVGITGQNNETNDGVAQRKLKELKAELDSAEEKIKTAKTLVKDDEKRVKEALDNDDYSLASFQQQKLIESQTALAMAEASEKQTESLHDRFEELIENAHGRIAAINGNRQALLLGVTIQNVDGIEDLGIVEGEGNLPKIKSGTSSKSDKSDDKLNMFGI